MSVAPGVLANLPNLADVDVDIRTSAATNFVTPVQQAGPAGRTMTLPRAGTFKANQSYFFQLENTPGGMLQPGNWSVNTIQGAIYFWAPAGIDPNSASVVAARLLTVLELKGDENSGQFVRFLHFQGLAVADVSRHRVSMPPPSGRKYAPFDAYNTIDSAVLVQSASDCTFEHCRITGVAGGAIRFLLYARNINLLDNLIVRCGGNGVAIVGYNPGTHHENRDNLIAGNTIQYCGQTYWHSAGIALAMAGDMTVRGNNIAFMPYAGIMAGGQTAFYFKLLRNNNDYFRWNEIRDTPLTTDNVKQFIPGHLTIEGNVIHDVMMIAEDGGAIYLWGEHDCLIRHNTVYRTLQDNSYGIYLDVDTLDSVVSDNVVYQCPLVSPTRYGAALMMNTGARDTITNNIFALTNRLFDFRGDRGGNAITRNIFLSGPAISPAQGPRQVVSDVASRPSVMDYNLYWSTGGPSVINQWIAPWRRQGWDAHSIVADPMFVDASRFDFRLSAGSPVARFGFKPISH